MVCTRREAEGVDHQVELHEILLCFFIYGFLGWCTEVAFAAAKEKRFVNRGFLNGPICPIYGIGVVAVVLLLMPYKNQLFILYVVSIIVVTALEWVTGFILEKLFHSKWWDYSNMPLNLNGYVCLLFSLIWGVACVVIVKWIHPLIYKGVKILPDWLGTVLLVVLGIGILADLYVTVTNILKMNRHLAKMEEIAAELRRISDELGENISENVLEAMEKREDIAEDMQEYTDEWKDRVEELKARADELRGKYRDIKFKNARSVRRILRAFPRMKSRRHSEAMDDLREYLRKEYLKKKTR